MARKPDQVREDIKQVKQKKSRSRRRIERVNHFLDRHWKHLRHGRRYRKQLKQDLDQAQSKLDAALAEGHDPGDEVLVDTRKQIAMLRHRLDTNWKGNKTIRRQIKELRETKENRIKNFRRLRARSRELRRELKKSLHAAEDNDNFMWMDGKPIPEWIGGWLLKAKANGWHGILVSGYRTPAYSQQLCYNMCGAPSCPGMCAGTSSNHCCPPSFKGVPYEGAADLSDYWTARAVLQRIGAPLTNHLPNDPVHVSHSGG